MNMWKPLALFSTSALVLVVGYQGAQAASPRHEESSSVDGDYRRMHAALDALRNARDHLVNAEHNHGGWRERAVQATDVAIHETEAAINWNP